VAAVEDVVEDFLVGDFLEVVDVNLTWSEDECFDLEEVGDLLDDDVVFFMGEMEGVGLLVEDVVVAAVVGGAAAGLAAILGDIFSCYGC